MRHNTYTAWEIYREEELAALTPILSSLGITLEEHQPHIAGERYLMQAVTTASGRKLILLGRTNSHIRVVVKATRDPEGIRELEHERSCRDFLTKIRFAYEVFHSPEELHFVRTNGFTISVHRFIEQTSPFIERPLKEQFTLALCAFKAQEGAHATTHGHTKRIRHIFGTMDADAYLKAFGEFKENILSSGQKELSPLLEKAQTFLTNGKQTIEQYTGFLTHTDFVPHNFRVANGNIYLLDHSSLRFGNKYEGWARFLNFMALYNPPLEEALTDYVRLNRAPEELRALQLMRIYRLGEILWYYTRTLECCEGTLAELNQARIQFWSRVLAAVLEGKRLPQEEIDAYTTRRDSLRSDEEKMRQQNLH